MNPIETFTFDSEHVPLVGILHRAQRPSGRGVLMLVGGGPQYRAGGHRQLIQWARALADNGYDVFRFDYRGMGDSYGEFVGFERADADIASAIDEFRRRVPAMHQLVLWGECDAAASIAMYAFQDPRVNAAVMQNPWVRTNEGQAKAIVKHYYLDRLRQPSFWKKLFSFQFNPLRSLDSLLRNVRLAGQSSRQSSGAVARNGPLSLDLPLPVRLREGLERFSGPVLIVLSGRDHIAREFDDLFANAPEWRNLASMPRIARFDMATADHTFSSSADKDALAQHALGWLAGIEQPDSGSERRVSAA